MAHNEQTQGTTDYVSHYWENRLRDKEFRSADGDVLTISQILDNSISIKRTGITNYDAQCRANVDIVVTNGNLIIWIPPKIRPQINEE